MKGGGAVKKTTLTPRADKKPTPESRTRFKAWISKYALSRGVFEVEVEDRFDIAPTLIASTDNQSLYRRDQWHRTMEVALEKAEKMRVTRIAALQRQLGKLKKLTFDKAAVNVES
jgi:hypothetical protein